MTIVNVVVTCTKKKKHPIADECKLRNVPGRSLEQRMGEWQGRLTRRWRERVIVADLYAGDHWSIVRELRSPYFDLDIWVCSAGFGLVRYDDTLTPYAATFSCNHPDSVSSRLAPQDRSSGPRQWWHSTSLWKSHFKERPRSLEALMATYPSRATLVVASKNYLRAISDDLRAGLSHLNDPDNLAIVSAGSSSIEGLEGNLVPCDARLQAATGGARRSLNTRLASKIIREAKAPFSASTLCQRYRRLLEQQPPLQQYDRRPQSDANVARFIRQHLKKDVTLRHSPLLRMLRDSGLACEQKRFSALYKKVRGEFDA